VIYNLYLYRTERVTFNRLMTKKVARILGAKVILVAKLAPPIKKICIRPCTYMYFIYNALYFNVLYCPITS